MIATISADIVRSTSLRTKDLIALRDSLHSLFVNFEKDYLQKYGLRLSIGVAEIKYAFR